MKKILIFMMMVLSTFLSAFTFIPLEGIEASTLTTAPPSTYVTSYEESFVFTDNSYYDLGTGDFLISSNHTISSDGFDNNFADNWVSSDIISLDTSEDLFSLSLTGEVHYILFWDNEDNYIGYYQFFEYYLINSEPLILGDDKFLGYTENLNGIPIPESATKVAIMMNKDLTDSYMNASYTFDIFNNPNYAFDDTAEAMINSGSELGADSFEVDFTAYELNTDSIVDLQAGYYHKVILTDNHRVLTTGSTKYLGDGVKDYYNTGNYIDITENFDYSFSDEYIDSIWVSHSHSVAISNYNNVFIWGTVSQAGYITELPYPVDITVEFPLSGGEYITSNNGFLFKSNTNKIYQLNSLLEVEDITTDISLVAGETVVEYISTLANRNQVIRTSYGRLLTRGMNNMGQLGNGSYNPTYIPNFDINDTSFNDITTELYLESGESMRQILQFSNDTFGVLTNTSRLLTWGMAYGFSGHLDVERVLTPTPVITYDPLEVGIITEAFSGYAGGAFITSTNHLYTWGGVNVIGRDNDLDGLGYYERTYPMEINYSIDYGVSLSFYAPSYNNVLMYLDDGTILGFGVNDGNVGQILDEDNPDIFLDYPTDLTDNLTLTDYKKISNHENNLTVNGITFTEDMYGNININGTATDNIILQLGTKKATLGEYAIFYNGGTMTYPAGTKGYYLSNFYDSDFNVGMYDTSNYIFYNDNGRLSNLLIKIPINTVATNYNITVNFKQFYDSFKTTISNQYQLNQLTYDFRRQNSYGSFYTSMEGVMATDFNPLINYTYFNYQAIVMDFYHVNNIIDSYNTEATYLIDKYDIDYERYFYEIPSYTDNIDKFEMGAIAETEFRYIITVLKLKERPVANLLFYELFNDRINYVEYLDYVEKYLLLSKMDSIVYEDFTDVSLLVNYHEEIPITTTTLTTTEYTGTGTTEPITTEPITVTTTTRTYLPAIDFVLEDFFDSFPMGGFVKIIFIIVILGVFSVILLLFKVKHLIILLIDILLVTGFGIISVIPLWFVIFMGLILIIMIILTLIKS